MLITKITPVAAGIRRIEALTGGAAVSYIQKTSKTLQDTARLVKEKPESVTKRVENTLLQLKIVGKEAESLKTKIASMSVESLDSEIKSINGNQVLAKRVAVDSPAALRDLDDRFKDKIKSGIIVLGTVSGSKALLIVVVTRDLVNRYHAGEIVRQIAPVVGGGGGGRPDMAQAGGTMPEKLDQALDMVYKIVAE